MKIIAGQFKGRILKSPKTKSTRPTQAMLREALFNICQDSIEGAYFLDLFAGSGAIGLEALSRGAKKVVFVESDRHAIACIRENINLLQVHKNVELLFFRAKEALCRLKKQNAQFDFIYVDPPYEQSFSLEDLLPLLSSQGQIFLEKRVSSKEEKEAAYPGLRLLKERKFGMAHLSIWSIDSGQM